MIPGLIKSFIVGAAGSVEARHVVGFDDVGNVTTDIDPALKPLVGIALHSAGAGERVDVALTGIVECVCDSAFDTGSRLTASVGAVYSAAPLAGANTSIIGIALEPSSGLGAVIDVFLCQGIMQG